MRAFHRLGFNSRKILIDSESFIHVSKICAGTEANSQTTSHKKFPGFCLICYKFLSHQQPQHCWRFNGNFSRSVWWQRRAHTKLLKPMQVLRAGRIDFEKRCETNWLKACGFRGWLWNLIPPIKRKQCRLSGSVGKCACMRAHRIFFDRKASTIAMNILRFPRNDFSTPLGDDFRIFSFYFHFSVVVATTLAEMWKLAKTISLLYESNFKLLLHFSWGGIIFSEKNFFPLCWRSWMLQFA